MKNFLITLLLSFAIHVVYAQDFEGIVEFKLQEGTAIENSVWYVKGDMVRVDEFETGTRVLKGCYLINTKDSSIRYLDHKAKIATAFTRLVPFILIGTTVETTKNTKEVLTFKTTESVVKLPGDSTLSYWMNNGKFGFFKTAAKLMGPLNTYFNYYWVLDPKDGSMPMLVIKKNSKGEETGRLEVIRIEKRDIDEKLFAVPADYKQQD